MNKFLGALLVVGVCATVAGAVFLAVGYSNSQDDGVYITKETEITDSFTNFSVDLSTSKFEIKKSEDGKNKVVSFEKEKQYNKVSVANNSLVIKQIDERPWYARLFTFDFYKTMSVTLYLTEDTYGNMSVETDTGSITLDSGFKFSSIKAKSDTGSVYIESESTSYISAESDTGSITIKNVKATSLTAESDTGSTTVTNAYISGNIILDNEVGSVKVLDTHCSNLDIDSSTGSVKVADTLVSQNMKIKSSTGSISLERVDAATANLKTSTGSISGTFLTSKIFSAKSSTGRVNVPTSTTGGLVVAESSTGSITLSCLA